MSFNSLLLSPAETDDLFDPLEDSQTLNTFTRRDHLFARLDFSLEKATVTLFQEDKLNRLSNESGVIQLEFSGGVISTCCFNSLSKKFLFP